MGSPLGKPLMERPTTGEKENRELTKHRLRQFRLHEPNDLDIDLNSPSWIMGDSIDEKPSDRAHLLSEHLGHNSLKEVLCVLY
jgi:hypothetical protein